MTDQLSKSDAELRRNHWDKYNPVNNVLREVVEPLAADLAIAAEVLDRDDEQLKRLCNTYHLPYGRMNKLPPALFGTITKDIISRDRDLVVPTGDSEIETMADSYMGWIVDRAQTGDYKYVAAPTRDVLVETMKKFKGQAYPEAEWAAAAAVTQQALRDEPLLTIDIHRVAQINGGAYSLDQLPTHLQASYRQQTGYTLAMSQLVPEDGRTSSVRELVQLPIGEYGQQLADTLARSVVVLGDFIRTSPTIDEKIATIASDDDTKNILRKHTMRTRESYDRGDLTHLKNGVSDVLIGGILSMAQTISFLTAEKVPGYENYNELVEAILDSDVIEEFARIAPVGYIGPVTLAGIYVPGALDATDGKLSLHPEFKRHISEMRRGYFAGMAIKWALYDQAPQINEMPRTLGLTCPASEPHGAIATLRPVLKSFLRH
ncbi:MAG: hypothetical protein KA069_01285 [Candidatus Saccharimonas sp.]|nr:hypothetical protein [Candidatus Saccharimonas sp.]